MDKNLNIFDGKVYFKNKELGNLIMAEDGYYYFDSTSESWWSSYSLNVLSEMLNELNKEWNEHIQKQLG